jgi:hypothetical protein
MYHPEIKHGNGKSTICAMVKTWDMGYDRSSHIVNDSEHNGTDAFKGPSRT